MNGFLEKTTQSGLIPCVMTFLLVVSPGTAMAGAATQCLADLAGQAVACTGTGVTASLSAAQVLEGCDYTGDTATLVPAVEFASQANRYDIVNLIALDGGDALTGFCQALVFPESSPFVDLEPGQIADTCGDIEDDVPVNNYELPTIAIPCLDRDRDGRVDTNACVAWSNNGSDICQGPADLSYSNSRCTCSLLNVDGLPVPMATVEVKKLLVPPTDDGLFDLQIDGISRAEDVSDGGTTGPVEVLSGQSHLVGELAGTSTSLENYLSSIQCFDRVGRCSLDQSARCVVDEECSGGQGTTCNLDPSLVASCTDCTSLSLPFIPPEPATIECTITNTAGESCDSFNCDDGNPCTLDACTVIEGTPACSHQIQPQLPCGDPDTTGCNSMDLCGLNGQCIDHVDPEFTVCRAATGICDAAEVCDGIGKACPADQLTPEEEDCEDLFRDGFELPGSGLVDSP